MVKAIRLFGTTRQGQTKTFTFKYPQGLKIGSGRQLHLKMREKQGPCPLALLANPPGAKLLGVEAIRQLLTT